VTRDRPPREYGASQDESARCDMSPSERRILPRQDVNSVRCDVLFASGLQPSAAPTAEMVARAINRTVRQFGSW
jgi:hypothetical protein